MFSAHPDFQYGVRWFPNRKIDRAVPFHNFFIRRDLFYRTQESRDDVTRTSWGRCDLSISYYYISVLYLLFFFLRFTRASIELAFFAAQIQTWPSRQRHRRCIVIQQPPPRPYQAAVLLLTLVNRWTLMLSTQPLLFY